MAGQLIPLPEFAPPVPENTTPEQNIAIWVDLMNAGEAFLLAGLRRDVGENGDLRQAYREWYDEQMKQHDQTIVRMLREMSRRESAHACEMPPSLSSEGTKKVAP